ncbi:TPA: HAMP domain-containing histidine kinase [Vibrio vulnificus]|nr:HAMP domain-containing histidine kinase [Vibrio vulnificus]
MLNHIIEKKIIDTPWPVYVNGEFLESDKLGKYEHCSEQCLNRNDSSDSNVCEHGLSYISRKVCGQLVTVAGVFIPTMDNSKKYKRNIKLMQRKASMEAVNKWFSNLDTKSYAINSLVNKTAKNNFDQFHEFVKWAREIGHYSERLLAKSTTSKLSAFENASEDLKSLYKTSVMLLDSLDTTAIYFNPASAKFGRKKMTDIYSMVHKIKLVLSHASTNKSRANVVIKGRVENKHKIYESFKIVPLSLIQNAIKYRLSGDVEVIFNEVGNNLTMSVNSIGYEIPCSEIDKLFVRGFRTRKAREMAVEGSGLGLYVLKVVIDAHEFQVSVSSTPINSDNKKLALNSFTVQIH